jgi:hypothetical protein
MKVLVFAAALSGPAGVFAAGDPWAAQVVSYSPGSGVNAGYDNPSSALGEPTRFTGVGVFPGAVTPFNPAYLGTEIVSIGPGGSLVVGFGQPVTDDPANPYGIDLLCFGNAGYIDTNFPTGTSGGMFGAGGGLVEVSADGLTWFATTVAADGRFPTLGYADLTDPYALNPGGVPADFTRPVDPAFDPTGLNFQQISAAYGGSGGGAGIDLATLGLAAVTYVRISNLSTSGTTVDIDGLSDVAPVPAPGAMLCLAGLAVLRRRPVR